MLKYDVYYLLLRLRSPLLKLAAYMRGIRWGKDVQIIGLGHLKAHGQVEFGDRTIVTLNHRAPGTVSCFVRNATIGKDNFISVGRKLFIGRRFYSSSHCDLLCATHAFDDPTIPYQSARVLCRSRIWIQDNVFLGARSSIVGNVRIGFGSFVNANSVIDFDVPPLSFVGGSPPRVLKRFNWATQRWENAETFDARTLPTYGAFRKALKWSFKLPNPYAVTVRAGWM